MNWNRRGEKPPREEKTKMSSGEFFARELPILTDIVTFCNTLPMSLYADTTVVKSPEVVFRGLALSQNRLAAEEYLLNFRRSESDLGTVIGTNNYGHQMAVGALANRDLEEDEENLIPLPAFQNVRAPIGSVIRSRRSVRQYSGKPVSLQDLSTLLFHTGGITGSLPVQTLPETASLGASDHVDLRAAASAGGLYPIDLFVLALNVERLPAGAYRYLPKHNALRPVESSGPIPPIETLVQLGDREVGKASFMLGYVYNLFENSRKYGDSGLGFAFIEAGSMAAHVHLICTALSLGSCDIGSFSKTKFEQLFDADGISRHMIHLTVIGR